MSRRASALRAKVSRARAPLSRLPDVIVRASTGPRLCGVEAVENRRQAYFEPVILRCGREERRRLFLRTALEESRRVGEAAGCEHLLTERADRRPCGAVD